MLFTTLAAMALQAQPLPPGNAEEQLIAWAVADFEAHSPGPVQGFRTVQVGSLRYPDSVSRPMLCGEVEIKAADGAISVIPFATLETQSGYEQWLGGNAATSCNPAAVLDTSRDLAPHFEAALLRRE